MVFLGEIFVKIRRISVAWLYGRCCILWYDNNITWQIRIRTFKYCYVSTGCLIVKWSKVNGSEGVEWSTNFLNHVVHCVKIKNPIFHWYLILFLSEAVEASQCHFFWNWLMKHKCPILLNPLCTIIR